MQSLIDVPFVHHGFWRPADFKNVSQLTLRAPPFHSTTSVKAQTFDCEAIKDMKQLKVT